MRLFIAINFTNKTHLQLLVLCDELRLRSERGRFSLPENLHLTLTFLGECDEKQTSAVKSVINNIRFEPFYIEIDHIGRFKRNSGDTWWAGVRKDNALLELQQNLTSGLRSRGFNLETRKYNPHITLGREVRTDLVPRQIEPFSEAVSLIYLMKSELINGKLTYTAIHNSMLY